MCSTPSVPTVPATTTQPQIAAPTYADASVSKASTKNKK